MSKLKEEILSEVKKRFIWCVYPTEISAPGSKPTAYFNKDVEPEELIDFLSSKLDEIEKEVMTRLKAEKETWAEQSIGWKAVESCENAIKEVLTPPSKL